MAPSGSMNSRPMCFALSFNAFILDSIIGLCSTRGCIFALRALEANTTKNEQVVRTRLDVLIQSAKDIGLEFVEPDGAMYLFAKTKHKNFDATKFSEKLLERGVAIAPGEGFGDYKEFFRITAIDETRLKEGMIILDTILKESYE